MSAPHERPGEEPDARVVLATAATFYAGMMAAACGWLWARDRLSALPEAAVGTHGPWLAAGVGLAVGLAGAGLFAWLYPRAPRLARHIDATGRLFARVGDPWALVFVVMGAIAEELMFRLAVQDAFGLGGAVAAYALLHISIYGPWGLPLGALHAFVLGSIVQHGFGLLGSTTATAIMNHLALRRFRHP